MSVYGFVFVVLIWGMIHSLLASTTAKGVAQRWLGDCASRFYRLGYNLFAGLSFLPVLVLFYLTPGRLLYRIPLPWVFLSLTAQGLTLVALVVGFLQSDPLDFLGLRQLTSPSDQKVKLNKTGLYRYVRHPLYTAGLMFIWLSPLLTDNLLAINIGITTYIVIGAYFEERKLAHALGDEFVRYRDSTPMLFPGLRWNKKRDQTSI